MTFFDLSFILYFLKMLAGYGFLTIGLRKICLFKIVGSSCKLKFTLRRAKIVPLCFRLGLRRVLILVSIKRTCPIPDRSIEAVPYQGVHCGACPWRKIYWGSIFRNVNSKKSPIKF